MSIIGRELYGITIGQRSDDGYVNATALAKAYKESSGIDKRVPHWLATDRAKIYMDYLSAKTGIPVLELVQVKRGGNTSGTWIHPDLATPFSTWLSVEIEFQVSAWIKEWLMTGQNPVQPRNRVDEYWLTQVREQHQPWEQFFDESFRREAERVSQYKWEWRVMAKFINSCIYDYFPKEMRDRLDKVNPFNPDTGCRPRKQHQHLEDDAQKSLRQHIKTVQTLMEVSYNRNEFDRLIAAKFNGQIQPYLWM